MVKRFQSNERLKTAPHPSTQTHTNKHIQTHSHTYTALDRLSVPVYLYRVEKNQFLKQIPKYGTDEGMQEYDIIGAVPQGLVLGPNLWYAMYDCLPRLNLPIKAEFTAFADDVMITIAAKYLEEAHRIFQEIFAVI